MNPLIEGAHGVRHSSELNADAFSEFEGYDDMIHKSKHVILKNGDEVALEKVIENVNAYNLVGADFSYCVLDGLNFINIDLTNTNFYNVYLKNIHFSNLILNNVDFRGVCFSSVTISSCKINSCKFDLSSFYDSTLVDSEIHNGIFAINHLCYTKFQNLTMFKSSLFYNTNRYFRMENIRSYDCDFSKLGVLMNNVRTGVNLLIGYCMDLTGFCFTGIEIAPNMLMYADITGCDFSGVDLSQVSLEGVRNDYVYSETPLSLPKGYFAISLGEFKFRIIGPEMCFEGLNFNEIILNNISLVGSDFTNCTFKNASFKDINFSGSDFTNCSFKNASFKDINFSGSDFTNLDFANAEVEACRFRNLIKITKSLPSGYSVVGDFDSYSLVKLEDN